MTIEEKTLLKFLSEGAHFYQGLFLLETDLPPSLQSSVDSLLAQGYIEAGTKDGTRTVRVKNMGLSALVSVLTTEANTLTEQAAVQAENDEDDLILKYLKRAQVKGWFTDGKLTLP